MDSNRTKKLILMVDDNEDNLKLMSNILIKEGFDLALEINGKDGINFAINHIPDLILLDVMMPAIDGYEVCKILKQNDATKYIPVIFLTAKTNAKDIAKGFEVGAVDYIPKPFEIVELISRVNTHIRINSLLNEQKELINKLENALSQVKQLS